MSDDDTTMKSRLTHSWKQLCDSGKMKTSEWPKTKNNQLKKDNGKLPLHVIPPSFLADPNHRKKVVGKQLYAMATAPKKLATSTRNSRKD